MAYTPLCKALAYTRHDVVGREPRGLVDEQDAFHGSSGAAIGWIFFFW